MTATLVVPGHIASRLQKLASSEVESGAVLLARLVMTPRGNTRLLATELHEVPDDAYEIREHWSSSSGQRGMSGPWPS